MRRQPDGVSPTDLHRLFRVGTTTGLTDGQLLERFATHGGEAAEGAFAALVERHGPMVFRACRGILRDDHEAMDAFQATFLILLHKGGTLWVRDSLGPWLHRVACRAAGRARIDSNRRRLREREAAEQKESRRMDEGLRDFAAALHEEVDLLPNRYRVPLVLCDLEGRTYEDAARHMGCPVGTVRSRLARGRAQLRGRLIRRGLAPAGLLGAAGATDAVAAVPTALVGATIQLGSHLLTGGATAAGAVSTSVLKLAKGAQKAMLIGKLKVISVGLLAAVGLAAFGVGIGARAHQAPDRERLPTKAQAQPRRAQIPNGERPGVKTLPNGATIEVIGISTHPSGPDTWWAPDGSPLAEPPCDPPDTSLAINESSMTRVVVARVSNLPPNADHGWWIRGGSSLGQQVVRNGKVVPDLKVMVVEVSKDLANLTVHFHAAAGPWQTVATLDGRFAATSRARGDLPSYMSGAAIATRRGTTTLTVTHNVKNHAVRLVAVDLNGDEHPSVDGGGVGVDGFTQLTAEYRLMPEQIREFRLQRRPYEQVDLTDLAAYPRKD